MQVQKMNLLNALSLILLGIWGYLETKSGTALIPAGFGVTLLFCHSGLKNKIIAHVAVLLTLLILVALVFMRLEKSIESGGMGLVRVILMIFTSSIAMISFVKSFIDARKN